MVPPGQPPPMPPSYGAGAMAAPAGNLASPGLRLVGGLIDLVIIGVVSGIIYAVTRGNYSVLVLADLILTLAYFGYFLSAHGQSIGMMVFGFHVRDVLTGQSPSPVKAVLRGFGWWLELGLCVVGWIGFLWMFWDPQKQGIHDKVAGTIVTTS